VLQELGWRVLPPSGGLFLVASPERYLGKTLLVGDKTYCLSGSNINEALYYSVGLLINNEVWTGIPGYCRFVLSVEEATFEAGLQKLRAFDGLF
jgi:methionine S-methyltransferase